jgi:hypothetical protein
MSLGRGCLRSPSREDCGPWREARENRVSHHHVIVCDRQSIAQLVRGRHEHDIEVRVPEVRDYSMPSADTAMGRET